MEEDDTSSVTPYPILSSRYRITCATLSFLFGIAGTSAVFVTTNQVGTGGLLLIAVLLFFVAVNGKLPTKLKLGENTVEWLPEVLANTVPNLSPQVRKDVVEKIKNEAPSRDSEQIRNALDRHQEFTAEVRSLLGSVIDEMNSSLTDRNNAYTLKEEAREGPYGSQYTWDFFIDGPKRIGVEVKAYQHRIQSSMLLKTMNQVIAMARATQVDEVLIISSSQLGRGALDILENYPQPPSGIPELKLLILPMSANSSNAGGLQADSYKRSLRELLFDAAE